MQTLDELRNFQNTLTLARIRNGDSAACAQRSLFRQQLELLRRLNYLLFCLFHAAHCRFQRYRFVFPITVEPAIIRDATRDASAMLDSWQARVAALRKQYRVANCFSNAELWRLIEVLRSFARPSLQAPADQARLRRQLFGMLQLTHRVGTAAHSGDSHGLPALSRHRRRHAHCAGMPFAMPR